MSNFETLLTAWLQGGDIPDDFTPTGNFEAYLLAIINGVDDDVDPKSRGDVLLDAIATKYAGYNTGLTDLANALGIEPGTPQAMNEAVAGFNGIYKDDVESKGATGVLQNTLEILAAYSQLPTGGGGGIQATVGYFEQLSARASVSAAVTIEEV